MVNQFGGRGKKRIQNKNRKIVKVHADGYEFDSEDEMLFYVHLKNDPRVKEIDLQPIYQIIEPYKVRCVRCSGKGTKPSEKTGNPTKCRLCNGSGQRRRKGNTYTADFKVTYIDGYVEVFDVKRRQKQADNEAFPFKKKLFEMLTGLDLVIVRRKKGVWERDEK